MHYSFDAFWEAMQSLMKCSRKLATRLCDNVLDFSTYMIVSRKVFIQLPRDLANVLRVCTETRKVARSAGFS